ncbi:hypothetical protein E2562_004902 [Oryza meyeriana var. granulata]|uniref:Uncharacterized protein n=1 Tax=Oryza meyeriana var. granulata TaxID=110450 RepID=A0A6G1C4E8_9ORYZ|nr:hypothetical protein E2562_004902 [Oryza meyeriana var. granulata]
MVRDAPHRRFQEPKQLNEHLPSEPMASLHLPTTQPSSTLLPAGEHRVNPSLGLDSRCFRPPRFPP